MKKIGLILLFLFTSMVPIHAANTCEGVTRDLTVKKGATLQCLTDKNSYIFESLRGPAIVNFWGSWCAPCLDEIPYFRSFVKKYPKMRVIGIDVEERKIGDGQAFVRKNRMNWPNFYDASGSTRGITGVGVPITLFIDKSGKIKYKKIGVLRDLKELETLAKKYLAQ